jgi:hypothetical protein
MMSCGDLKVVRLGGLIITLPVPKCAGEAIIVQDCDGLPLARFETGLLENSHCETFRWFLMEVKP